MDMLATIIPKSDQLNADDLIGGRTMTVTITKVSGSADPQQPVIVNFDGDNGKPYKPCKSMRRVLVHVWGKDGKDYVGRSLTLYRDDRVMFGGIAVGGIRISHMSHMPNGKMVMALTASKAQRKPYEVLPLVAKAGGSELTPQSLVKMYDDCKSQSEFDGLEKMRAVGWKTRDTESQKSIKAASDAAKSRLTTVPDDLPALLESAHAAGVDLFEFVNTHGIEDESALLALTGASRAKVAMKLNAAIEKMKS